MKKTRFFYGLNGVGEWINGGDGAGKGKAKSVSGQADVGEVVEGRAPHDESLGAVPGAAAWILAWFACGGIGTAESIEDMRTAVEAAATHLSCLSAADLGVLPGGSSGGDGKAPGNDGGPDRSGAGESESDEGTLQVRHCGFVCVSRLLGPFFFYGNDRVTFLRSAVICWMLCLIYSMISNFSV